ncbi:multidrug ABC transporter ATP-binding protein [Gordonibacter sp. 28C]|uniref:ABC transporter ATP-binding protein n=1 Tax=Gordonibacter sp. 28C TaxID=2078569 RepID=UPI000DF7D3D1|nr:ABC transporter ATP-binding protein [Gordonibacter sp. 28C]RDB64709.1 multidrug ABC transporter ATP-binding protein [Gordonibacter sp. 28C]
MTYQGNKASACGGSTSAAGAPSPAHEEETLLLDGVGYAYRGKDSHEVLSGICTGFREKTMYAVTGPSGSGKTTLLSLLAGLDAPTSGRILLKGKDIREGGLLAYRRDAMSLVFQSYNLIDYLTVRENVLLGGPCDPDTLLTRVGIDAGLRGRSVLRLSGGQQQRVAIARALAGTSEVLLADEPTGNLDEETEASIIDVLKRCAHEDGKCVIVVTHSSRVCAAADEVVELSRINKAAS